VAQSAAKLEQGNIQERIHAAIAEFLRELGSPNAIATFHHSGRNSHLENDLGLGSLERAELIQRVESAVGIHLPESTLADVTTAGDLADIVNQLSSRTDETFREQITFGLSGIRDDHGRCAESDPPLPANIATLVEVLQWRARFQPQHQHIFLYEAGDAPPRPITHADLLQGAEAIAAALQCAGLERGGTVALMLPTCVEFFWSFFGVLLAGGVPVPIYPPLRADRIEEYAARQTAILRNAQAQFLLTFREVERLALLLKGSAPTIRGVMSAAKLAEEGRALLAQGHNGRPKLFVPHHAQTDNLAFIQYTSGSTGSPKGVMLTHANLLANIRAIGEAGGMGPRDVAVSWLPLYHDMGLIGAWLVPLYFGIPVAILSPLAFLTRPSRWLRAIHMHRGTLSPAPNFAYEMCVRKIPEEEMAGVDLSCWRAALNGAEPVRKETVDRFSARFKAHGFCAGALIPVYGLAEATLAVCAPAFGSGTKADRIARDAFQAEGQAVAASANEPNVLQFVSVGKPLPGVEIRIGLPNGRAAAEREEGSLLFRSPAATQGYYRNPEATAELIDADGWVDSGDMAYQAEGEIFITGRAKDIIIKAGRNITPYEIEEIAGNAPGVRPGCVVAFGAPDQRSGTEKLVIVAELRPVADRLAASSEIAARVNAAIGIPPDVVKLVSPGAIPKTSSGKLRRNETRRLYLAGTIGQKPAPAWIQSAKLAVRSALPAIRNAAVKVWRRPPEIAYGIYTLAVAGACLTGLRAGLLFTRTPMQSSRMARSAARVLLRASLASIEIENGQLLEDFHRTGPWIFVPNHSSYADIMIMTALLPAEARFVAKAEVLEMPLIGGVLRKAGHFAFDRSDPGERIAQAMAVNQALQLGQSVIIYPEGTFTASAGIRPFQLGAFKAAIETGRPICPVVSRGAREFFRESRILPRRSNIRVTFGPLLWPTDQSWRELVRLRDTAREVFSRQSGEPLL
jgi:1-acyl-sn-glycerol-3-phosphate acyltransferase